MNENDLIEHILKIDERLRSAFANEQMHKKLGNNSPMQSAQKLQRELGARRDKAVADLEELRAKKP